MGVSTPAVSQSGSDYAFHINFQLDEQVSCPGKCDTAYISHMVLYLRGDVAVDANGSASGSGVMRFISVDACQTLLTDISSCSVTGFTDGAFTIEGRLNGNDLEMTLHLTAMPVLSATMMTQMPSGSVSISLDGMYEEEIKQTLMNAGVFEKTFLVSPEISTTSSAANFEGEYVFGGNRTMHGFGGLFFISPDMPMP